jgi:hypothetical protein
MNAVEWTSTAENDYLALLSETYQQSTENGVLLYERM